MIKEAADGHDAWTISNCLRVGMHVIELCSTTDEARVQSAALLCSPRLGGIHVSSQHIDGRVRHDPEGNIAHFERTLVYSIFGGIRKKQIKNSHTHTHRMRGTPAARPLSLFFMKASGSAPDITVDLVSKCLTTCEAHIKSSPAALNTQPWEKKREWKDFMGMKRGDN